MIISLLKKHGLDSLNDNPKWMSEFNT